jgi:micrococcal nuclease
MVGCLDMYGLIYQKNEEEIKNSMFNAILTIEGYVKVSIFPTDVKYVDCFTKFQKEAREKNRGLWGSDTN